VPKEAIVRPEDEKPAEMEQKPEEVENKDEIKDKQLHAIDHDGDGSPDMYF
jgi:hypothetical protein